MKKDLILENITIEKLIFGGKWLATAPDGRRIIISGGAVPESVVNLRVLKSKKRFIEAQILDTVKKSPLEQELPAHFQVYGGCKWLPIAYEDQLRIKSEQIREAFHGLEKYWIGFEKSTNQESIDTKWDEEIVPLKRGEESVVADEGGLDSISEVSLTPRPTDTPLLRGAAPPIFHSIVPSPEIYWYRNKVEFSWGKYISAKEDIHDEFRFGFHAQGQFDRIIDCDYCVLADDEINAIFKEVDAFSRNSGLPTYDPKHGEGFWRHLVIRKARYTEETMVIFSINSTFPDYTRKHEGDILAFVTGLMSRYPHIVSVYLLHNSGRADIVQGDAILMRGKPTITEHLLGKTFEINPKSFFQTNSPGAEKLYSTTIGMLQNSGGTLLDLYGWTGTIWLLLSDRFEKVYSVEIVAEASADGARNAMLNGVVNMEFVNAKTEDFLKDFLAEWKKADTLVIDPPRDGMHPSALPEILKFGANEIIYVSCNPATLVRDLEYFITNGPYRVTDITPVDMFPHTHHIETVARLERISA